MVPLRLPLDLCEPNWLLRGRQTVKIIINECTICRRYSNSFNCQRVGDLPQARTVTPSFPFKHSGIGYAGPIDLRLTKSRGKGTMKGDITIFICRSTRADLELLNW